MAKKYVLLIIVMFFMVVPVFSQQDHQEIVEEVSVTWWQVPVFALDADGKPVTDLKEADIEITLNDGKMPTFTLTKRFFTVTERKLETVEAPTAQQASGLNKKVILLLFDLTLSGELSINRAKKVAEKIVLEGEEDARFFVLSIEPLRGLVYIGEGTGKSKDAIVSMIKERIQERTNSRVVNFAEIVGEEWALQQGAPPTKHSKYEADDYPLFIENVSKMFKRKSMGFFYSFEALYFLLNSIEDNKFIYFFSEGMSGSIMTANRSLAGDRGMYNFYIERIGKYLERCGAVLFIINTMGVDQYTSTATTGNKTSSPLLNSFSNLSGEDSLHLLTKSSGGTYMEGTDAQIVERLEKVHQAYYEVSFPDPPQIKGNFRDVEVVSKRKGIKIISLKSLEKRKHYTGMKPIEKDMLVINLVTQPPNTMIKSKILAYNAQVDDTKKSKKQNAYSVTLPPSLLKQNMDLYKVWLSTDPQGISQVEKIERESLHLDKNTVNIEFSLTDVMDKKDKKEKKPDSTEGKQEGLLQIDTYFVLVDGKPDPAKAYIHGIELYDEDPELIRIQKQVLLQKRKGDKTISAEELNTILQGAADYCDRLKQSAFHFYCQEKILETKMPLTDAENQTPNINVDDMRKGVVRYMDEMRNKAYTQVKGYLFGYRLIKQGDNIKENRDFIASRDEIPVSREDVLKTTAFFSEKAIFAPITLLDRSRQDKYRFQFIRFAEHNGRQAAVIEAVPMNPVETATIYGKLWIDVQDFSVMKIEADPASMRSYQALEKLAKELRTKLHLSLDLEFDFLHEGIRFPTKVSMLEKYKGGRIISDHRGSQGWERTRAQFSYSDYQFFSVETDVKIDEK